MKAQAAQAVQQRQTYGRECPVCHEVFGSTAFRDHMDAELDLMNMEAGE